MPPSRGLLRIRFNQDQGCFVCALESGVKVYNVEPLAEKSHLDFDTVGGVGHAEMLERSNLLAIVGGGHSPKFPDRNVMIWDDRKKEFIYEFGFSSRVLSVRLRKDKLVVVLMKEIHIFSFPFSPKLLKTIETAPNPRGLCEVCPSGDCQITVFPGQQRGTIRIVDLVSLVAPEKAATEVICPVHQHDVSCIAINYQGTKIATASVKGTLIRIHSTQTRSLLLEVRRGADQANIHCLSFSLDSVFLCCSSDKGTVHIFAVENQALNKRSSLAQVGILGKTIGSYVESQWGLAQFSLPGETACSCAFVGDKRTVVATCLDGKLYKYSFTLEGNCFRDSFDMFLDVDTNDM